MSFLNDTFTDTDGTLLTAHAPESGGTWNYLSTYGFGGASAGAVLTGNAVRSTNAANSGGNAAYAYSVAPPAADYTIYATLRYDGANTRQTGILLRASTTANSGYNLFCDPGSGGFTLYRSVGGTLTSLGVYAGATTSGASVNIEFSVSGTGATVTLNVVINGVTRITASDTDAARFTTAGNVVLILYGGTDFRVDSISSTPPADTLAPTLTSPVGTTTGTTTATVGATTNEANGTLFAFVSTSATPPIAATLKAGTGAAWAGSQAITTTGAKTLSATGLTAATLYYAHLLHADAAGNDSSIVTSASFTTTAGGDVTAPTLTSPTGAQTGATTASGTVTTDEANGTLYFLATTNATETAATVKASGSTQSITTTGSKSVTFTGLTAGTTYYAHYVHRDASGNDSARVSSASFTTAAAGFDLHSGAGLVFGDLAGALTSLARQVAVAMVLRVYNASTGALVVTSGTLTTDSNGRLARYENASIAAGTAYHLVFVRTSDGEVAAIRMTAT